MNKSILIFATLSFIISLVGCQTKDIMGPEFSVEANRLVVSATLTAGTNSSLVYLSRSVEKSNQSFSFTTQVVSDAIVQLYENGELVNTPIYSEDFLGYFSNYPILAGNQYEITVSHSFLEDVRSHPVLIPAIPTVEIDTFREETANIVEICQSIASADFVRNVQLSFSINPNLPQYYKFKNIQPSCGNDFGTTGINCLTEGFDNNSLSNFYFSDECFSTTSASINIKTTGRYSGGLNPSPFMENFTFSAISESAYLYEQSLIDVRSLNDGFVEPRTTYTNIENGYGVVRGVSGISIIF